MVGPCEAAMPRYYYDTESESCEFFYYGGCEGNANNFETRKECVDECGGPGMIYIQKRLKFTYKL